MENNSTVKIIIKVLAATLVLGAVYILYVLFIQPSVVTETPELQPELQVVRSEIRVLFQESETYQRAEAALDTENFDTAIQLFTESLNDTQSPEQEAQVKFKIAAAQSRINRPEAINIFKEIAANVTYPAITRATAVEYMGRIYYNRYDTADFDEIFKDEPYNNFLDPGGDKDKSLLNLYEYSSSLYPVADSELRIAVWYGEEILRLQAEGDGSALTEDTIERYNNILKEKLHNADLEIDRFQAANDPARSRVPRMLMRKAIVLGLLYRNGDRTAEDPEEAFKNALIVARVRGLFSQEGFTLYSYAAFLANAFGEERSDDISNLLKNFYEDDDYETTSVFTFFANTRDLSNTLHNDLEVLADIDPQFKSLLNSLGWELK